MLEPEPLAGEKKRESGLGVVNVNIFESNNAFERVTGTYE